MTKVVLAGVEVMLDEAHVELVLSRKWCLRPDGYLCCSRTKRPLHRMLFNEVLGIDSNNRSVIDHINQNKMDNRLENLRLVSKTTNALNSKKRNNRNGASSHKGVSHSPRKSDTMEKPWRSRIFLEGREYSLGYFETEGAAASAYEAASDIYIERGVLPPTRPRRGAR